MKKSKTSTGTPDKQEWQIQVLFLRLIVAYSKKITFLLFVLCFLTWAINTQDCRQEKAENISIHMNDLPLLQRPSMSLRSWETILHSASLWDFSLLGQIESSSSMKMIASAFFSASSKALRRLNWPASLDMISGPLKRNKNAPVSLSMASTMRVLPVPGGSIELDTMGRHHTIA